MRTIIMLLFILCTLGFTACEPDVAGEGITLPSIEFAFSVGPDTGYLKVGDTFSMYVSVSSTLSNGVKLTDGEGEIWFGIGRGENVPRTSFDDVFTALNNEDYQIIIEGGG